MSGSEDWIMRPILRGMCKYESVKSGEVSLYDIALMNEALDVEAENLRRLAEDQRNNPR